MTTEEAQQIICNRLSIEQAGALKLIEKAKTGQEINENLDLEEWLKSRLLPNTVLIDEMEYSKMCIDALKILGKTAATDYGGSRQRDLGQLWADMTRGYLGELAISKFLENNWNIK